MAKFPFAVCVLSGERQYRVVQSGFENTAKALRWLKQNAEEGVVYRVISFRTERIKPSVETERRVKLWEYPEPSEDVASEATADESSE